MSGIKHDGEKPRTDLLPPLPLLEVAKAFGYGAAKYSDFNYRKGFKRTRLLAAALRHLFAWAAREDRDPDSGLSHLAHAGASVLMLLDMELLDVGQDDRWKRPEVEVPFAPGATVTETSDLGYGAVKVTWHEGEPVPAPVITHGVPCCWPGCSRFAQDGRIYCTHHLGYPGVEKPRWFW